MTKTETAVAFFIGMVLGYILAAIFLVVTLPWFMVYVLGYGG